MSSNADEVSAFTDSLTVLVSFVLAVGGAYVFLYSPDSVMQFHAALIAAAAALSGIYVLGHMRLPAGAEVQRQYMDGPVKVATIAAVFWGVVGFLVGVVIAWQLAFPVLNFDLPWTNFGRLRPLHTSAVIFAFGGNALLATSLYCVQRTCRARLAGRWAPWFVVWGYQLFIVLAATGYVLGVTQSKEYAEPEWYVDIWLTVVWVVYLLVFLGTLARRKEPHIYVANWFFLAFIVTVAMLHLVNNATLPVSFLSTKSYIAYTGVQDAMTQWWYGHNAVGFFLTAGFLGIMYYFIPKRVERPIYSYRLSIVHFWSLIFLYIWAGPHHLHYTALPDWAQTLGATFSVMLWMPSWGGDDQRTHDAIGRLGQAQDGPGCAASCRVGGVLRNVDVRRAVDEHQGCELTGAQYRLGRGSRSFRCAWMGRHGVLWGNLLSGAVAMEAQGAVLNTSCRVALLDRDDWHPALHHIDVGFGDHAGSDVASLR